MNKFTDLTSSPVLWRPPKWRVSWGINRYFWSQINLADILCQNYLSFNWTLFPCQKYKSTQCLCWIFNFLVNERQNAFEPTLRQNLRPKVIKPFKCWWFFSGRVTTATKACNSEESLLNDTLIKLWKVWRKKKKCIPWSGQIPDSNWLEAVN